jgi:hypothetical protein
MNSKINGNKYTKQSSIDFSKIYYQTVIDLKIYNNQTQLKNNIVGFNIVSFFFFLAACFHKIDFFFRDFQEFNQIDFARFISLFICLHHNTLGFLLGLLYVLNFLSK